MPTAIDTRRWRKYCQLSTSTSTSYQVTLDPWQEWSTAVSTCVSTTGTAVWYQWTSSVEADDLLLVAQPSERSLTAAHDQEVRSLQRQVADGRAKDLLCGALLPSQLEEFERHGHIVVNGRHARYRIRRGRVANIDVIDRCGVCTHRLCAHPAMDVPDYDTMLAQKLMLEFNEEDFIRTANRHERGFGEQLLPPLPA